MSADEVASFYRDETARIRYSMILFNWFGVGLIPIVILLAMQIRRMAHRTPILSYSLIACAGGPPTLFLIANMFWLLGSFRPGTRPRADPVAQRSRVAHLHHPGSLPDRADACCWRWRSTGTGRTNRFSNRGWHISICSIAVALAPAAFTALASTGPVAWDGLLSFWVKNIAIAVWIVVMGVVLGQTIRQQRAEDLVAA